MFGNIFENRRFELKSIQMKILKIIGLFLFLAGYVQVNAQEVTDYDLQNFARSYRFTVLLNNEAQREMQKEIEKEGLTIEKYQLIQESKHPEATLVPDLPEKDFEKFEKLQPKIKEIQADLEKEVLKVYADNDLDKQKYRAIAERVKQDYLLQAKMEKILAGMR